MGKLDLRAFEYAMEVHMTAYNAVNGCPAAAPNLLLGILREELGFEGVIMPGWATYDTVDVAAYGPLQSNAASLIRILAKFS